jgi:Leucine-rich repeat (LRR) protein
VRNKPPLLPEEKYKKKVLDGYLMLKLANTQLPQEVITLDCSERNITSIEEDNFSFFNNLLELNLSNNCLQLSPAFARFENLEILNLQGNNIKDINFEYTSFIKLKTLNLSFNYIS